MRTREKVLLGLAAICAMEWAAFAACIVWPALGFSTRFSGPLIGLFVASFLAALVGGGMFFATRIHSRVARWCLVVFIAHVPALVMECAIASGVVANAFA